MALTIRARLTLWYSLVVLATLLATAIVLSVLHQRLGLSRIDAELDGNVVTVSNWVDHEFEEGLDPRSHMARKAARIHWSFDQHFRGRGF